MRRPAEGKVSQPLAPVAWAVVISAALAQALALTLGSGGYGYHRDELYYRMLPTAWGYVDQPPLTPLLARATTHLADQQWALRLPATIATAASVIVVALIARRLGGGRGAQALAAWGYAFAALPLMLGHLLLTSTIDLPLLLLVVLAALRAVDGKPRAWLLAGALAGVTSYNRLLVVVVGAALAAGLLVLGPRRELRSPFLWGGAALAGVIALPQIIYQTSHGWPQLDMGKALSENNSGEVRAQLLPLLLVMLGPPLVVVWGVGIGWLLRSPQRARHGFLVVAFALVLVFTAVSGAQPHYPVHLLSVMYAAGCVPVAAWLGAHRAWRRVALALLAVNAAVSVVLALPVVPLSKVGDTPLPDIGPLVADQVGWDRYVAQIGEAYRAASTSTHRSGERVEVIASNYGEAGAIARLGPAVGLPQPFSGQNGLYEVARPQDATRVVVIVGGQFGQVRRLFESCQVVARLDNGVDVDNEEQGQPIAVCREPRLPWSQLWPHFQHLD